MSLLDVYAAQAGPTGQPLIQTPSTPGERFTTERAAADAPDNWWNITGSRRDAWQLSLDALHKSTGTAFANPYGAVTPEEMMRLGNQPAVIEERRQKIIDAHRSLMRESGVSAELPDPEMIDQQIGQQGQDLRNKAAALVNTGNGLAAFAGGATALTPVNVAGFLIPPSRAVFGAATVARGFLAGVGREAAYQGITQGALTAASEGLDVLARTETGTAPTLSESVANIAMGTAAGAVLGGAFHAAAAGPKALWERWNRLPEPVKENAPLEVRDAMKVLENDTIYGEANRLGLPWAMHTRLEREAMDPILRGRAAVLDELRPGDTPMTALATILRASENVRGSHDLVSRVAERVAALPDAELEPFARQVNAKAFAALDRVAAQMEEIRGKIETMKAAAPDAADLQKHEAAVAAAVRASTPEAKAPADFTPEPHELETAKRVVRGWDPEKPIQRPTSLIDFVRKSGGLRNDQPEAADLLSQDIGRQPGLLRSKEAGGVGYDDMARRAQEQGYDIGPDTGVGNGVNANRFMDMLIEDASGRQKHYPMDAHTDAFLAQQEYFNEFGRHLKDVLGINPKGMNPRDLAYLLRQDGQSSRLMVLLHKAETLGDESSLELASLLDAERAAMQREIVDAGTAGADHGYPAATLDELERYYADIDRTTGESGTGGRSASEEPIAGGSVEGGETAGTRSDGDRPATEATGHRPSAEQRLLEARLAKLEEQHDKASQTARAEIADLRANIDKLEFAKPEEVPGVLGLGSNADVAKALEAAEFDRLIRTVPENVPGAPQERTSATKPLPPTADGLATEQTEAINAAATAVLEGDSSIGNYKRAARRELEAVDLELNDARAAMACVANGGGIP